MKKTFKVKSQHYYKLLRFSVNTISFDDARSRLNCGKEVWFCAVRIAVGGCGFSQNIKPTLLGDFDEPRNYRGLGITISDRYFVMGSGGKPTKKSYKGHYDKHPVPMFSSRADCVKAYNEGIEAGQAELDRIINHYLRIKDEFEAMKQS